MITVEAGPVADSGVVATTSPWPLVLTIASLVALFLLTESVRLVGRGERLVVRRGGTGEPLRVAGPGLVLVAPLVNESRTIRVTTVDRKVVAPGPVTAQGARLVLIVRVAYRVEDPTVHRSDECAWRSVQVATRRAVARVLVTHREGSRSTTAVSSVASALIEERLRERVTEELADLGIVVADLRVERTFSAPEPRLTATAAASST